MKEATRGSHWWDSEPQATRDQTPDLLALRDQGDGEMTLTDRGIKAHNQWTSLVWSVRQFNLLWGVRRCRSGQLLSSVGIVLY